MSEPGTIYKRPRVLAFAAIAVVVVVLLAIVVIRSQGESHFETGTARCVTGKAIADDGGRVVNNSIANRPVELASDGDRIIARITFGPGYLDDQRANDLYAIVSIYGTIGGDRTYNMSWTADYEGRLSAFGADTDGPDDAIQPIRWERIDNALVLEASAEQLSKVDRSFRWSATIESFDQDTGANGLESTCGIPVNLSFPQDTSATTTTTASPTTASPTTTEQTTTTTSPTSSTSTTTATASISNAGFDLGALPKAKPRLNEGGGPSIEGCTMGASACGFENGIDLADLKGEIANGMSVPGGMQFTSDDVYCDGGQVPPNRTGSGKEFACSLSIGDLSYWVYVTPSGGYASGERTWLPVALINEYPD